MKSENKNDNSMSLKLMQSGVYEYVKLETNYPCYELLAAAYTLKHPIDECNAIVRKYANTFFRVVEYSSIEDWKEFLQSICNNLHEFIGIIYGTEDFGKAEHSVQVYDESLARYATSLLKISNNSESTIYCPLCKLSLISAFNPSRTFDCFDSVEENVEIARIINELSGNYNATFNISNQKKPIDINILNTHQHVFVATRYYHFEDIDSTEQMISSIVENWQPNTKAVILCPTTYLYGIKYRQHRQSLISNNYIRKIISLPVREVSTYVVNLCLILLDNSESSRHSIIFVDFSKDNQDKNKSLYDFEYEENESERSVVFDIDEINASNLSPSFYHDRASLKKELSKLKNPTPLLDLVEFVEHNTKVSSPVRVIDDGHVRVKSENAYLDYSFVKPIMPSEKSPYLAKLDCDCILIRIHSSRRIISALYHYTPGDDCYVERYTSVLKPVSNVVSLEYLVSELEKQYVERQIVLHNTYDRYNISEFLSVIIELPPTREEQLASIISSRDSALINVTKELVSLKEKEHNDYMRNLRVRKHAISHTLGEVKYSMNVIDLLLEKYNGILDVKSMVGESSLSVDNILAHLRMNLYAAIKQVETLVDSEIYGEPSEYNIVQLVSEFIKMPHNPIHRFNNISEPICDDLIKNNILMVSVNKDNLFNVFKEIVNNAIKYGFDNTSHIFDNVETNKITFFVTITDVGREPFANIIISNNGNPLPEGMTSDKIFTWGISSGSSSGIGGWDIKNTIENFGGYISVNEESDRIYYVDECQVYYSIKLPITNQITLDDEVQNIMD